MIYIPLPLCYETQRLCLLCLRCCNVLFFFFLKGGGDRCQRVPGAAWRGRIHWHHQNRQRGQQVRFNTLNLNRLSKCPLKDCIWNSVSITFRPLTEYNSLSCSFERAKKDTFDIKGKDIGELTHLIIRHDNKGMGGAWHLEQIEVVHPFSRKTVFFPCNEWLQKTKEEGLDGCQRTLKSGKSGPGQQFKVGRLM